MQLLSYICLSKTDNKIGENMIDAREILFIRRNAPRGFYTLIAENLGVSRVKVKNELNLLKEDYDKNIVKEARRLLKAIKGIEYENTNA
jgi:hypothetical protein